MSPMQEGLGGRGEKAVPQRHGQGPPLGEVAIQPPAGLVLTWESRGTLHLLPNFCLSPDLCVFPI